MNQLYANDEIDDWLDILATAINNHRAWFESLHHSMLCGQLFPIDILHESAHTRCQFGKWYYSDASAALQEFEKFEVLEEIHRNMHDHARTLADLSRKKIAIDPVVYQKFLDAQNSLMDILRSLQTSLLERKYSFDALTGIPNRRAVTLMVEQAFENNKRYGRNCSVAMIDADYFKKINDSYGHLAGDYVLKWTGKYLKKKLRKSDFVGRYGGEEFLVIMQETGLKTAFDVIDKIRDGIAREEIRTEDFNIRLTVSAGISEFQPDDENAWLAVKRADMALYQAKQEGRNRSRTSDL